MEKIREFFSSINKNIFFESLLLIATLCLLIMAYVIVFAFFPIVKANKEKNISLYTNTLDGVQSMIDYSLLNMHDILTKTSQESSIIGAVVSPQSDSHDMDVLLSISALSGENELIDGVFLYIPQNGKVFDSRYVLASHNNFYKKYIIDKYYKNYNTGNCIDRNGRITRIIQYGSELFLIRDFPLDGQKRLGTFFIKINKNKLFQNAGIKKAISPNQLFIYDLNGIPLFENHLHDTDKYRQVLSSIKGNTVHTVGKINKRLFLYSKSNITQLQYFFATDDIEMFNIKQIIILIIPIFFLCLLMAFFLTKKILLPIKNIIYFANNIRIDNSNHIINHIKAVDSNLGNVPQTGTAPANSINDLKVTFSNTVNSITHLKNVISILQPDISSIVFNDLLSGKPMQISDIDNILNSVNSPINVNGIYNVMVFDIAKNAALDLIDEFLALSKNTLDDKKSGNFDAYYLHMINNFTYVVIFQFEKGTLLGNIKRLESELRENFLKKASNLHMDISIKTGNLCNSILDIQFSFKKACQQNFQNATEDNITGVPNMNTYYDKDYFAEHSKKFFELIQNNDEASALLIAQQVFQDIRSKYELSHGKPLYTLCVESILDTLLKFKNVDFNKGDLFQICEMLNTADDWSQMEQIIDNFHKQVIPLALTHYKKLNNQYFVKAENYIQKCYADSSLSLSTIAEYLNTNATYLSKLFKDSLGTNFNDYLNSYRIEKAKSLLCNSNIKIESVATATGFNSQQNFIRVFKKSEGITPGHYRYLNQGSVQDNC
ncbi:MAG TPA: hypothetical protein DDW50_06880 [Firmicutes bacterium]|jgi:two-component system, response regulator YesN|nr:hypothetical protein [Bacillota bacterium]